MPPELRCRVRAMTGWPASFRCPSVIALGAATLASTVGGACGPLDTWPDDAVVEAPIVDGMRETSAPPVRSRLRS
jgi:hypothetical protein